VNSPIMMRSVPPVSGHGRRRPGLLTIICSIYLAVVIGAWLMLQWSDQWWPATILMFAPRWVFAIPLGLLLPLAAIMRSWSIVVVLVTGLFAGWLLMGFNIPWQRLTSQDTSGTPIRVMTLNMHYSKADPIVLEDLIEAADLDIVAVQEWNAFHRAALRNDPSWYVHANPRLFLASRHPITKVHELGEDSMGKEASVTHYELDTPIGVTHVFNIHTATTREGISDTIHENRKGPAEIRANSARRREQSAFVAKKAAECKGPLLILGDFNTPPESTIFADVWSGYSDSFTSAGWGWGYTFIGAKTTVRIDHILTRKGWACTACRVGPYVGSPHRPLIAELVWKGQ
jgi:vancomycin resistance protein VanJ